MDKTTVLIVEDEAIVAADLAGKLGLLGYTVVGTAADGENAVEMACRLQPNVVLMDIRLRGEMDGIEAAEAIQSRHCAPVIYLTAHSDAATLERAKLSGPFGFILKPFEERELATTIEMAIFKHRAEMEIRRSRDELEERVEERTRELAQANAYNRSLIEASLDPLVTIGRDGRITDVNAATEEATGLSRADLIGTDFSDYFTEPDNARDGYERVFAEGVVRDYPLELRHRDGGVISVLYNASVYRDARGEAIGVFAVARDITARKRAEDALIELNDTLEEQVVERTAQLKSANETLRASRVAALNLMEDAVDAKKRAEETSTRLLLEIDERRRAEVALSESEERLRLFIEHAPAGLAMFDRDMRYIQASRRWRDDYRLGDSELSGAAHYDLFPEISEEWKEAHRRGLAGEVLRSEADRFVRSDGSEQWVRWEIRPWYDPAGAIGGIVIFAEDITESKQTEKALLESESFYSQTLESIPGMVFTTRPDGYCDYQSRQWVEFTGVPMTEHLGDGWNRLLHPDDRPRAFAAWRDAVKGRAPYNLEYRVRRHDGEYEWFKVIGRPIRDGAGKIVKWFGVAVNIEEIKRGEEELKIAKEAADAASRAKSLFLANMSHELRTPMTGVLGMLEIARSGPLDEKQREAIDTAYMSGKTLLMIINDILDLTRVESGRLVIEDKPFNLHACVAGTVDVLMPEAQRKGIELVWAVDDGVPESVSGDQVRLIQVITNLIGNALKFTERGKVDVRVTAGNETPEAMREITFTVSDTGIGVPNDKRELIFGYFTQADITHTRKFGGTGLGLAICKQIVELMGGSIGCESRLGEGSSFTFMVPLALAGPEQGESPEPVAETESVSPVTPAQSERRRLLVAEDDEVTRKVLGFMLQKSGFDYDFAMNGVQVVEMWEKGEHDLIVMDGQMPGMDGFEATRTIRERERKQGGHIPIVAMTAHALKEDRDRCLSAGMDDYVSKPIDFGRCMEVIRGLLYHCGGKDEKGNR